MTAWNADTEAGGADAVTLVEGSSFCILPTAATSVLRAVPTVPFTRTPGLCPAGFCASTAHCANLSWRIVPTPRGHLRGQGEWPDGRFDSPLVVRQDRHIGPGLQDDITLENYSAESVDCEIELLVDADQADLFDVKGGRAQGAEATLTRSVRDGELLVEAP